MSSMGCPGFRAHTINPNRCRRCFKDQSEHGDTNVGDGASTAKGGSGNSTISANASLQRNASSYTGDTISQVRKKSFSENSNNHIVSSSKSLSAPTSGGSGTVRSRSFAASDASFSVVPEMSASSSPSASFTLKSKRVKFLDPGSNDDDNNGKGNAAKNVSAAPKFISTTDDGSDDSPNVEFTISVKKPRSSISADTAAAPPRGTNDDYQSRIKELSQELSKAKEKIDVLETKNKEIENMKKSFSRVEGKDSIKQNFDENIKLKKTIDDLEQTIRTLKSDKKNLEDKLRASSKSSSSGEENVNVAELRAKLEKSEKLVAELSAENDDIKKDVKSLEVEFQELHDNFREDHSSEFRVLKRDLETMSKNCRVMNFKLKKAERTIEQLENEKVDLQKSVNELYETAKMDVDKRRMKELENELSIAKEVSLKLHAEIETLKEERMMAVEQLQESLRQQSMTTKERSTMGKGQNTLGGALTPKLSPTPSFDQSNKDYEQVVRDLYDTMERERDLQEQLKFAEEETKTMHKKLSTMEQENEILMMQIRKMASKNSGTSAKDEDDDDGTELNPEEMKLHLELYEQEMVVLRRKTDELEQENENFQQEIKYLQEKLVSQPLAKVEIPEIPAGSPPNVIYDHKIRHLETEARELRKKLIDREKENESLRTEVELHRRRASKVISRSRSLDGEGQSLDMKKQLQLFEQEAAILRQKLIMFENENEKLLNENKRLQLRISKKPPPGPADQLQLENMELKDKIRDFERKCDSLKTDLMNAKLNETTETETDYIANLKKQLRAKETEAANLGAKISQSDLECSRINREYKKLKESLAPRRHVNRVIRETATRLELKEIIKEMEEEISEFQITNKGKDVVIENLTEEISELKREYQGFESKNKNDESSSSNGCKIGNKNLEELRKRLEDEQHRVKSLEAKLEKFGKDKNVDFNLLDNLEVLQMEKKEIAIKLEDAIMDFEKAKSRADDLAGKLDVITRNKDDLVSINHKLRTNLEKCEDEVEELTKRMKTAESGSNEVRQRADDAKRELERVSNLNAQLKKEVEEYRNKLSKMNTGSGNENEQSVFLQKECADLRRKLEGANRSVDTLQRQIDQQKAEMREKETKWKAELNEKLDNNSKKIRREVHRELQDLREECTAQRNRCNELVTKLDQAERELKDSGEKLKTNLAQMRKEREELNDRIESLESQVKSEQRKKEKLEREMENVTRGKEQDLLQAQEKIVQMERDARRWQAKMDDVEYAYQGKLNLAERESSKLKQDYEEITSKYEMLEKDFVDLKSRAVSEKETLLETVSSLKKSYEDKVLEVKKLKDISLSQQKEWFKEKLHYQEKIASLESKLNKFKLVEEERDRMKTLIADKENLLNSYRKEERSHNEERERNRIKMDDLIAKLTELERAERNTRFMSVTGRAQVDKELQDYRIRLEHSETSHKGELAALHAEYEGRMRLLGEEVEHMQQQMALLAQERDRYRESLDKTAKEMHSRVSMRGTLRDEIEDLNSQLRTVRSDLEGALLENRNLKIQHGTERSSWQIQIAEYKTQLNQMEERILLECRGNTRNYARTKMELAWEKERQENHRLLQETQRFIQELRDKLVGIESLREKEREEARKQLLELKTSMDKEHVDTQQKVSELHFDLLALKEAHSRLKSQNERLRRERTTLDQSKVNFVNEEIAHLQKLAEAVTKKADKTDMASEIGKLQQKLKSRLDELIQEANVQNGGSDSSRLNGSLSSLTSTALPPPSSFKRAPPRTKLTKKSLSLDQHLTSSGLRGASQERIWDSDHSLNTTPNSSVSNLRFASRYGYAGYESDSSGGSFFIPHGMRLNQGFTKEGSLVGGSESDTSAASSMQPNAPKKSLKEKFKIRRTSKTSEQGGGVSEDEAATKLKQKLSLQGFEMSPLELAKQREKKEKSLRYKISKTLSKTFSRSTSVLPSENTKGAESQSPKSSSPSSSRTRNKSPSRTKSPTRIVSQEDKLKTETAATPSSISTANRTLRLAVSNVAAPSRSVLVPEPTRSYNRSITVPGLAQLRQRPTQSNLAIPPSRRSPPKSVRLRTETNV